VSLTVLLDARLTRRMSAGMRVYVTELAGRIGAAAPDISVRTIARGENFSLTEQVVLPWKARHVDLVHFPTIFAPVLLPRRYVVTIHDLIHLRFPELFGAATAAYYRLFVGRLASRAARVIVGDERTRSDCARFLGIDPERVRVVPLGYDPALLDIPAKAAARPYLLYVGNHRPHKNLHALIAAWRSLPADLEVDLLMTGEDDLEPRADGGARRLVFLGELPARETAAAIRGALALVQPSLAEGFGLPVLEAIVRAVPVIAGEDACPQALAPFVARFPPHDVAALHALLEEVARAPQRLRARAAEGAGVARAYTWDRFAATVASVYRDALGGLSRV
jgi:glycosyltransferase involved in cell wall biosynthesis